MILRASKTVDRQKAVNQVSSRIRKLSAEEVYQDTQLRWEAEVLRRLSGVPGVLPLVSTFEGDGSWNDRMEHVGGHFSRDVIEAKEEREDEDLTHWALQEGIIKDSGNGVHVLADQPPSTRKSAGSPAQFRPS